VRVRQGAVEGCVSLAHGDAPLQVAGGHNAPPVVGRRPRLL
jgi:hypothetical protein